MNGRALLELLQLADSALPIGATAHSWGLESLAAEGFVTAPDLRRYLDDLLSETWLLEAVFCRAAHDAARSGISVCGGELDGRLSAMRPAREVREASLTLGRRFVELAAAVSGHERLQPEAGRPTHLPVAVGLVGGVLGFDREATVLAFLNQSAAALISAAVRLLPIGQMQASRLLWDLKSGILDCAGRSARIGVEDAAAFAPLPDLASMRHPRLETRLFIC